MSAATITASPRDIAVESRTSIRRYEPTRYVVVDNLTYAGFESEREAYAFAADLKVAAAKLEAEKKAKGGTP